MGDIEFGDDMHGAQSHDHSVSFVGRARIRSRVGWLAAATVAVVLVAACGGSKTEADPHLWLEESDSPRVQEWIAAENAKTLAVLEQDPRFAENLAQAVEPANAPDRLALPTEFEDDVVGNFWQDPQHPRGIWRKATVADYESPQPRWKTVLDLDALARAEGRDWVWKAIDCDPVTRTRCLVSLSDGGENPVTMREFDRTTGQFVADGFVLERGKQWASWVDGDTLLVSREWQPGERTASGYPYIVKSWRRGQPLDQAVDVARGAPADEQATVPYPLDNGAGRRLHVVVRQTANRDSQFSMVLGGRLVPLALPPKTDLKTMVGDQVLLGLRQDWTIGGTTFRSGSLLSLDVDEMVQEPQELRPTVVYAPRPQESFQGVITTRDGVVVTSLSEVKGRAAVYTLRPDGTWSGRPVPLPDNATVDAVASDSRGDIAYLSVTSLLTPTTLYHLNTTDGGVHPVKWAPARFDSSRLVVEQLKATSPDGTKVPYFIVHPADMEYDGATPTILSGYGGFADAQTPRYDGVLGKLWLERGGAYVVANIRGGGEYGPPWYQAALKTNRQKAFDDFTAVAQDLIARNIATPRHLGIQGTRAGGLLMGVQFTQHPDLYNAVLMQTPLLDMVRYEQIVGGARWVSEFGSMKHPDERAFLESISPYAQLKPGVKYPEPFISTTKDDLVGPQHARKFAARLSEFGIPYLFYETPRDSDEAGTDIDEQDRTTALEYTYFQRQLM